MIWFLLSLLAVALILGYGLRRFVCFRRKDCCGKGCGCLFPIRKGADVRRRRPGAELTPNCQDAER